MPDDNPLSESAWRSRVMACRGVKRELMRTWQDNVAYRKGKPWKQAPAEDTINVPADWSRTKNKQAQLFYQLPEVKLRGRRPEYQAAAATFAAALNFELVERVHPEFMMSECLGDVINASGIAVCKIGYDATFEPVDMSPEPPMGGAGGMPPPPMAGLPMPPGPMPGMPGPPTPPIPPPILQGPGPTGGSEGGVEDLGEPPGSETSDESAELQTGQRPIYECFYATHISPPHFLWPVEYLSSHWQKSPWLGWEDFMPLADAKRKKWVPESAEGVEIDDTEWLLSKPEGGADMRSTDPCVKYSEIFYRPYCYDPEEKDPRKIKRLVLIEEGTEGGVKKVIDEDFAWQKYDPQSRKWVGMTEFPIKVMTLSHISDQAIPPSDSEMGRPQVKELIKGRTQMMRQRDHSLPLRWYDINLIDGLIADRIRKGKYQDMIPTNGPGEHAIGEVARAQYPNQNFEFDKIARLDLDESWSMGPAQMSTPTPGDTTATEVDAMSSSMNTRLDFERAWVLRFFMEVAMGIGQLMQLFCDDEDWVEIVGPDGQKSLQSWNKDTIQGEYIFEAKPDSQLRLDVNQKRAESLNLYKLLRKDPLINPVGLVSEVLERHGIDPSKSMVGQQPPKPEKPKISYSFKGEDLVSPLVVALVQKTDTPVTPEDIQKAQQLLQSLAPPPLAPAQPGMPGLPPVPGQPPGNGSGPLVPTGENPPHPGPADVVQPLNRRYAEQPSTGPAGSRDSGVPTPSKGPA